MGLYKGTGAGLPCLLLHHALQLYSRRWIDADGLQRGLVLRTTVNNDEMPCSTHGGDIWTDLPWPWWGHQPFHIMRIRSPVDGTRGGWRTLMWPMPSIHGQLLYVMTGRRSSPIHRKLAGTTPSWLPDEYKAGFNTANQEWIWEVFEDDTQPVHYYSFYNYMSASCLGSASRTYPPCISKQIVIRLIPQTSGSPFMPFRLRKKWAMFPKSAARVRWPKVISTTVKKEFADAYTAPRQSSLSLHQVHCKIRDRRRMYSYFRAAEMMYNEAEAQYRLG